MFFCDAFYKINVSRGFVFAFALFAGYGCTSNPLVHLYVTGESTNQKDALVTLLGESDFKVKEFHASMPELEDGNYIVYYPDRTTDETTEAINRALRQIGLPEGQSIPFRIGYGFGSHEYTKGNVGLYLVKKSSSSNSRKSIDSLPDEEAIEFTEEEFGSKGCNESFILDFYEDGKAYFIHENSLKKYSEGKWRFDGSVLTIKKLFNVSKFEVEKRMISLGGNSIPVIDLIPMDNKNAPFSCTYSTYFKEGVYKLPSS